MSGNKPGMLAQFAALFVGVVGGSMAMQGLINTMQGGNSGQSRQQRSGGSQGGMSGPVNPQQH